MKFEVIDSVSVLYDQIAVHLNYYTFALYLLQCHVNVVPHEIWGYWYSVGSVWPDCSTP